MTTDQVKTYLELADATSDAWVKLEKVSKIIMNNSANIYIGLSDIGLKYCQNSRYYFDTENELLFIKKYTAPKIVSNRFNKKCKLTANYISVPATMFFIHKMVYPGMSFNGTRIREPKAGDIFFTIDKSTLQKVEETYISNVEYKSDEGVYKIYFDDSISTLTGVIPCWCIDSSGEASSLDNSVVTTSTEVNESSFDSVITFEDLGGFELKRSI